MNETLWVDSNTVQWIALQEKSWKQDCHSKVVQNRHHYIVLMVLVYLNLF